MRWVRAAVQWLERAERGWALRDDTGARWHADAVVLAIPAPRLARLLDGVAPRRAAAASRITSASSVVVALAVPGDTPFPECSGVLVASGEPLRAKAITLVVAQVGCCAATCSCCGCRSAGSATIWPPAPPTRSCWPGRGDDLATVFGLAVEPVDARVQRWIDAMPQYGPGHAELVAELRAGLPPTLAVAGSYLDGIGVPACIGAAGRAVEAASIAAMRPDRGSGTIGPWPSSTTTP